MIENKDIMRLNMCIIHALYKNIVEQLSKKYKNFNKQDVKPEVLYEIMHTSREDFSRYKNGRMAPVRNVMREKLISELKVFDKVLSGEKLIRTNNINASWAKTMIKNSAEQIVEVCVEETRIAVETAMKLHRKEFIKDECDEIDEIIIWMIERIGTVWQQSCGVNQKLRNAMYCMEIISVEELSDCDYKLLEQAYGKIKKKYLEMGKVFAYRELFKKPNGNHK